VRKDKECGTILYLPKEQKANSSISEAENIHMHLTQEKSSEEPISAI
jgi:hypothetical protein